MEEKYLWKEQLEKFRQAYLANGINQQYKEYLMERGIHSEIAEAFIPREASELYTADNNMQYHLNGRSILGVQRKWIIDKADDNRLRTKHGCSINPGLIQSDHSGFMRDGNMRESFIEAQNSDSLLDIAKQLFDLSNEEMAKKFNIKSSQGDIATLFNAIVLDPIINYEIEKGNTSVYEGCWNDSNAIVLSTSDGNGTYEIRIQNRMYENDSIKPMVIELPNGDYIIFKQIFNNQKSKNEYTIDDLSTEIIEVKGESKLIQELISQIKRFGERKIEQQQNVENSKQNTVNEQVDNEEIKMVTKQIVLKKIQTALEKYKNGDGDVQTIDIEEFELLNEMLDESIYRESFGYTSSEDITSVPDWYTPVPTRQYCFIQLADGRRICADFLVEKNSGIIKIKNFDEMDGPEDDSDFVQIKKSVDEQDLMESLGEYTTEKTLKELLAKKLQMQEQVLSEQERIMMESRDNNKQKMDPNIGE